jgi:hypothetical protein
MFIRPQILVQLVQLVHTLVMNTAKVGDIVICRSSCWD